MEGKEAERTSKRAPLVARLYVPLATLGLLLAVGDLAAARARSAAVIPVADRAAAIEACSRPGPAAEWLYLGNSQTSSMPERRPGDLLVPDALQALLRRGAEAGDPPTDVCSVSLGGMNLAEVFAVLAATGERRPPSLRLVLTSIGLDQVRTVSLREEVALQLAAPAVRDGVKAFVSAQSDLPDARRVLEGFLDAPAATPVDGAAPRARVAQDVEAGLQQAVEVLPLFARRDDLQRAVASAYVTGRNRLLGISSASTRAVAETTYRASLQLLELSLRYAQVRHLTLVVYVGPFRPRQPRPFPEAAFAELRRDTRDLCARYGARSFDYLDLLPESVYSVYPPDSEGLDGQPDFAHLTAPGHRALAERLFLDLRADLGPGLREGRQGKDAP